VSGEDAGALPAGGVSNKLSDTHESSSTAALYSLIIRFFNSSMPY
jgi:hypothetical protein